MGQWLQSLYTKVVIKIIIKILLVLVGMVLFIILFLSASLKFQLLNSHFWFSVLNLNNTYTKLSEIVVKDLNTQIVAQGGKVGDAKIITDLITPDNVEDLLNGNISRILTYINGSGSTLNVYIPINKVPKTLLPKGLDGVSQEMNISDLFEQFNVSYPTGVQIQQLKLFGRISNYIFYTDIIVILLIFSLLYFLTDRGKKTFALAILLVGSGLSVVIIWVVSKVLINGFVDVFNQKLNLAQNIFGIIVPVVANEIIRIWLIAALSLVVVGIPLFFVIRSSNNKRA